MSEVEVNNPSAKDEGESEGRSVSLDLEEERGEEIGGEGVAKE